jgi:hypothetical protein
MVHLEDLDKYSTLLNLFRRYKFICFQIEDESIDIFEYINHIAATCHLECLTDENFALGGDTNHVLHFYPLEGQCKETFLALGPPIIKSVDLQFLTAEFENQTFEKEKFERNPFGMKKSVPPRPYSERMSGMSDEEKYLYERSHRQSVLNNDVPTSNTPEQHTHAKPPDIFIGSLLNKDGSPMKYGNGKGEKTMYCGQPKFIGGIFQKACFMPLYIGENAVTGQLEDIYPEDGTCGPYDGMQCISCRIAQDRKHIGLCTTRNCHTMFKEMLDDNLGKKITDSILPDQIGGRLEEIEGITFKICMDNLNVNQSTKIIFQTAIEMVEEWCLKNAYKEFRVCVMYDFKVNEETFACSANLLMSCPLSNEVYSRGTGQNVKRQKFILKVNCDTIKTNEWPEFDYQKGWQGSYVKCTFHVDRSWERVLKGLFD